MINTIIGLYFMYLGIDIIRSEVVRHSMIKAAREGKLIPFVRMDTIKIVDPFSCIEEIPEKKEETVN